PRSISLKPCSMRRISACVRATRQPASRTALPGWRPMRLGNSVRRRARGISPSASTIMVSMGVLRSVGHAQALAHLLELPLAALDGGALGVAPGVHEARRDEHHQVGLAVAELA